jgi:ketopantoate reductase
MGEVGRRLAGALERAGVDVTPVTRGEGWDTLAAGDGPVLVCVREEALPELLPRLSGIREERLVFVQNGWVRPLLAARPASSRGLIWFTSKGEFFQVLRPSPFAGPLAQPLTRCLSQGGIPCVALADHDFAAADVEKMGFNCVVGLPLAVHGVNLGEYLERWRDEAQAVFQEAVTVLARVAGIAPDPHWWAAFEESAAPLHWVRVSTAKALEWRNGAVVEEARRLGLAAPVNARLLASLR